MHTITFLALLLLTAAMPRLLANPEPLTIPLWPGQPPGDSETTGTEQDVTKPTDNKVAGKPVIRLGNVTKPTLTIYRPPGDKDTRTAVLVCPGGAYRILAYDLEGTEVCQWLNSIGVTALLLKYRVPMRDGLEKHTAALQDAQRAMGLARRHAPDWKIQKIGVLGFSAGGHLSAVLSTTPIRTYNPVDQADTLSCRPDFAVLIYPAYLTLKDHNDRVAPELNVTSNTPPTFIVITQDDPVRMENALFYSLALKQAQVPVEFHLYPKGGHGYGLRRTETVVTTWPDRLRDWMNSMEWLTQK